MSYKQAIIDHSGASTQPHILNSGWQYSLQTKVFLSGIFKLTPVVALLVLYGNAFATENRHFSLRPYNKIVTLTGYTQPFKQITLSSEITGRCLSILADTGNEIKENQVVAQIDSKFIVLDLKANKLAREEAERQLAEEEKTLARFEALIEQKSTPQARLDEVRLAADLHRIGQKILENERNRLEEKLKLHTITAPPGWIVIEKFIEAGELIQAGQAIAKVGDFNRLLIPLAVTFQELQSLSQMSQLRVFLPDIKEYVPATIYSSSPIFDPKTRKIEVKVLVNALHTELKGQRLRGGMRAELAIQSQESTQSFLVPTTALIRRYDTHWLKMDTGDSVPVIVLGTTEDGNSTIISGKQLEKDQHYFTSPMSSQLPASSGK
jgi:RND family efflux transporter MFP subunit